MHVTADTSTPLSLPPEAAPSPTSLQSSPSLTPHDGNKARTDLQQQCSLLRAA